MKLYGSSLLLLISLVLVISGCSEKNDIPDPGDTDTLNNIIADSSCLLELFFNYGGVPVPDVRIEYADTSQLLEEDGYFSIKRDSGTTLLFFFGRPQFETDSLRHTFLRDTSIHIELSLVISDLPSDYYPVIPGHTWRYRYTCHYWPDNIDIPIVTEYIIERKIVDNNNTGIISELHRYGMEARTSDTVFIDTIYQVTEPWEEEGRIISFQRLYPSVLNDTNLVLNKHMEPGFNEGRTNIYFYEPMLLKEYQSSTPLSGIQCLYAKSIAVGPYYPMEMNEIYLADSIGLVKLFLEYWGMVDSYNYSIELIDFFMHEE